MRRLLALAAAILLAGCSHAGTEQKRQASTAVVIVSGGDATTPFTGPDQACATGLAAGNTDTALREYLLGKGYTVYTSPAMAGRGQVVDQTGFGPFGVCPITLPENMTVDSTGSIDTAAEHLARFLNWLHTDRGVNEVDFVGHSMGGLYSRAAIRVLASTNSQLKVRSLTTIGTPLAGVVPVRLRQRADSLERLQEGHVLRDLDEGHVRRGEAANGGLGPRGQSVLPDGQERLERIPVGCAQ
jgi:hypothetical protein